MVMPVARPTKGCAGMVLKLLGIALAVWIVLSLLGAVFKFLGAALVLGALLSVGAAVYSAVKVPVPAVDPALRLTRRRAAARRRCRCG
jgi:hypothetical protein